MTESNKMVKDSSYQTVFWAERTARAKAILQTILQHLRSQEKDRTGWTRLQGEARGSVILVRFPGARS